MSCAARGQFSCGWDLSLVCLLSIWCVSVEVLGSSGFVRSFSRSSNVTSQATATSYFDDISRRKIEAIEGQTVIIPCTIRNLSREKVVSWIRMKDILILTSGPHIFSSDYRYEVVHTDRNEDFWGLRIRGVETEDSGQYECQVNTEPKMSLAFELSVSSLGFDDQSKWLGHARIREPKEVFVQHGSSFYITCDINRTLRTSLSLDVWWLHEDTQIIELKESRISIHTTYDEEQNVIQSLLRFDYVTWQDGGLYTCLQPSVKKDSMKLTVVEAESSEAMQRDYPMTSRSHRSRDVSGMDVLLILCGVVFY